MLVLVLHSSRNLVTGQFFYLKKKLVSFGTQISGDAMVVLQECLATSAGT